MNILCAFFVFVGNKSDKDCFKLIREHRKNIKMMSQIVTEEDWDKVFTL